MGWLRNFVRRKTKPMNPEYALKMKTILSAIYFFAAWNALALAVYLTVKEKNPRREDEIDNPSKYYHRLLGAGDAKVIKFRGFTKIGEYTIEGVDRPDLRIRTNQQKPEVDEKHDEDLELLVEETNSF